MTALIDFFSSFEPMEWLTVGLLIFAGVQVLVPLWTERQRRREREADESAHSRERERNLDQYFQIAWAEYFRVDQLAGAWESEDLVHLSALGVLDPSDVLPRNWSGLMDALARLSIEAGYLGGVALTLGHDLARQVAILNARVREVASEFQGSPPRDVASRGRGMFPDVAEAEAGIKKATKDLALLLWDAARQTPRADTQRTLNFSDNLESEFGRHAIAALKEREAKTPQPVPKNDSGSA